MSGAESRQRWNVSIAGNKKGLRAGYIGGLLFLILALLLVQGMAVVAVVFQIIPDNPEKFTGFHIFLMVLMQASAFLLVFGGASRFLPEYIFFQWKVPSLEVAGKALGGLILLIMALGGFQWMMEYLGFATDQFSGLDKKNLLSEPFYFFLSVAVIAPLYEEVIFRGVLLSILWPMNDHGKNRNLILKSVAVFISSLAFTAMHFESLENAVILIPIFFLSLYLSFLTIRQESILLPVAIHFSQNLISTVVLYSMDTFIHFPSGMSPIW